MKSLENYDVIIIGGGAAGFFAARMLVSQGINTLILDMGKDALRKVLVSGGGRCNFTNINANKTRYFGKNPNFVISALSRFKPTDFLDWAKSHGLTAVEKEAGQFFCKQGATTIVNAMIKDAKGAKIKLGVTVKYVEKKADDFVVKTSAGNFCGKKVIVASGGISFPKLDVSDIGYKIAKNFGHKIIPVRSALVALKTNAFSADLMGISLPVEIKIGKNKIKDSLLFTHFGIGGPAAYRASLFDFNEDLRINFMPKVDAFAFLKSAKTTNGAKNLGTILSSKFPERFVKWLLRNSNITDKKISDCKDKDLGKLAQQLNDFVISHKTLSRRGFEAAEITAGGVDTNEISSKTFESKLCAGLYFVGEVLDVSGDLGGFNLHFAFASGSVAGKECGNMLLCKENCVID